MKPTVYIDLVKNLPRKFPGRRPQPWRYFVRDAGNHAMYEKSSEALTNRGDAITAIEDVHGPDATVVLREHGQPDRVLRQPVSRRIELSDAERADIVHGIWGKDADHPTLWETLDRFVDGINAVITQHEDHVHTPIGNQR
jgi:hypothetical protein